MLKLPNCVINYLAQYLDIPEKSKLSRTCKKLRFLSPDISFLVIRSDIYEKLIRKYESLYKHREYSFVIDSPTNGTNRISTCNFCPTYTYGECVGCRILLCNEHKSSKYMRTVCDLCMNSNIRNEYILRKRILRDTVRFGEKKIEDDCRYCIGHNYKKPCNKCIKVQNLQVCYLCKKTSVKLTEFANLKLCDECFD